MVEDDDLRKSNRVTVMMADYELELVDTWMFSQRLKSRSEAIRRLVGKAIVSQLKVIEDFKFRQLMLEEPADDDSIAGEIKAVRESLGLTQAQLGKAIGVPQGAISKWESGRETPNAESYRKVLRLKSVQQPEQPVEKE